MNTLWPLCLIHLLVRCPWFSLFKMFIYLLTLIVCQLNSIPPAWIIDNPGTWKINRFVISAAIRQRFLVASLLLWKLCSGALWSIRRGGEYVKWWCRNIIRYDMLYMSWCAASLELFFRFMKGGCRALFSHFYDLFLLEKRRGNKNNKAKRKKKACAQGVSGRCRGIKCQQYATPVCTGSDKQQFYLLLSVSKCENVCSTALQML